MYWVSGADRPLSPVSQKMAPVGAIKGERNPGPGPGSSQGFEPSLVARVSALAMFGEIEAVDLGLLVHPKAGNRLGDH